MKPSSGTNAWAIWTTETWKFLARGSKAPWWKISSLLFSKNNRNSRCAAKWKQSLKSRRKSFYWCCSSNNAIRRWRNCYFVTFYDDYSSHACVKFMRHKNQALHKFKEYIAENGTPRILRSDNGTKYTNKSFNHFCTNNKIKRDYTVPEFPEQNGVAERYNPTVVETARSLLIESKLRSLIG